MNKYFNKKFILANKEKIIKAGALSLIIIIALFVFIFKTGEKDEIPIINDEATTVNQEEEEPETIIADIGGAVNNPMVVELKPKSRISDAIEAAGGLTNTADISNINRAAIVNDGDKIYIPIKGENPPNNEDPSSSINGSGASVGNGKININTANSTELQQLTGVGPVTAEKILVYRSTNGRFNKIEDLKKVSGIGDKTFEKLKDAIGV